jgi:hypothetical protein
VTAQTDERRRKRVGAPNTPTEGLSEVIEEVLITPSTLQDLLRAAYEDGAHATHTHYRPDLDPDFKEAAWDYVAGLDFTTTTRPFRSEPRPPTEGGTNLVSHPANVFRLGLGEVMVDTGLYNDAVAVFIEPAPVAGPVGGFAPDQCQTALQPGSLALEIHGDPAVLITKLQQGYQQYLAANPETARELK